MNDDDEITNALIWTIAALFVALVWAVVFRAAGILP